jgi:hypothetical protein
MCDLSSNLSSDLSEFPVSDFWRIEDGTHLQFTTIAYYCREISAYLSSISEFENWLNHATRCLHGTKVRRYANSVFFLFFLSPFFPFSSLSSGGLICRIFYESFGKLLCKICGAELEDLIRVMENDNCWKTCSLGCDFTLNPEISKVFQCQWQWLHRLLQWKITDPSDPMILTPAQDLILGMLICSK